MMLIVFASFCSGSLKVSAEDEFDFFENTVVVGDAAIDYELFFNDPIRASEVMNDEFTKGAETIYTWIFGLDTSYKDVFIQGYADRNIIKDQVKYKVNSLGNVILCVSIPTQTAQRITFSDKDTTEGEVSGIITITEPTDTTEIDSYIAYFLNAANERIESSIGEVSVGTTSITVDNDTSIPQDAVYVAVFTSNSAGECINGAKSKLSDNKGSQSSIEKAADEICALYPYIGELEINGLEVNVGDNDKQAFAAAKIALQGMDYDNVEWDDIVNDLLTPEVITKFGGDDVSAKQAVIDFMKGFSELYYYTDKDELIEAMGNFRDSYGETFIKLFAEDINNSDVDVSDLYELLAQAKDELRGVAIDNNGALLSLVGAIDSELVNKMIEFTKTSFNNTIEFSILDGKLTALDWTMGQLIDKQQELATIVDPGREVDLALGKAFIRANTEMLTFGGTEFKVGDTLTEYQMSILGSNGENGEGTTMVDWYSTDSDVFDLNEDAGAFEAKKPGTTTLIMYRYTNTDAANDWIFKFNVTVTE